MILFENKVQCCACGACMNACSKQAIHMKEDEYGFLYPEIDSASCISCGACRRVCAFQNSENKGVPLETYVAVTRNMDILESASGGVFASLATSVMEDGGMVYGSSMEYENGKLIPKHIGISHKDELKKLQGSKYVQSLTGVIYQDVKKQLGTGRYVLFSGTPCQVDALRSYLGKEYSNLLTIDIICHGVPGVLFFQDYIELLEKRLNYEIVNFKFRDKSRGWGLNGTAIYEHGSRAIYCSESSYYTFFLNGDCYRINCYECKYACAHRPGDLSIGDYWGIEHEHPELLIKNGGEIDIIKGVSLILVNTEQGRTYLDRYQSGLKCWKSDFEKAARGNGQMIRPSLLTDYREQILECYQSGGYSAVEEWFQAHYGVSMLTKIKNRIPFSFKRFVKTIILRKE